MEFTKKDILTESSKEGSSIEIKDMEKFLKELDKNFGKVENILEKAKGMGMSTNQNQSRGWEDVPKNGSNNASSTGSNPAQSQAASSEIDPEAVLSLLENKMERMPEDAKATALKDDLKGLIENIFKDVPEDRTIGELRETIQGPLVRQGIKTKLGEVLNNV